jgi:hypothetical protein
MTYVSCLSGGRLVDVEIDCMSVIIDVNLYEL